MAVMLRYGSRVAALVQRRWSSGGAARRLAVGIDLGTTQSCVAYLEGSEPRVIADAFGHPTTPSVVAPQMAGQDDLVGRPALQQALLNPHGTFIATKRLIGRRFDDPLVCWPMLR